jgi:glyoxylase-like metal-dependent hydrolase (beta-lactamase superfamily II)
MNWEVDKMSRRKWVAAGVVAALTLTSGAAYSQGGFAPPELATTQVRDNIYLIRSEASGNITVIVGDDSVLLIDDKFAMDHDGVMAQLRKITDKPIRYVINTHMHGDHTGGNAAMLALHADIIAHASRGAHRRHGRPLRDLGSAPTPHRLPIRRQRARVVALARTRARARLRHGHPRP